MSDYYITPTEAPLSISRINRVTANNPSASLNFSTIQPSGTVIGTNLNPNSKISELADKSYKYLFSQNITSLTKRPIKFSDFRNNVFFAADVSVKPESPSAYGNSDDGQVVITPFGGTGEIFNVKLALPYTIIAEATFFSGGNLTKTQLDIGDYLITVSNLDNNLNFINSYNFSITVHLGGYRYYAGHRRYAYGSDEATRSIITTRHYFSR